MTAGEWLGMIFASLVVAIFVAGAALCILAGLLADWIADGEADANGDPERDAGALPEMSEEPMPRPWKTTE